MTRARWDLMLWLFAGSLWLLAWQRFRRMADVGARQRMPSAIPAIGLSVVSFADSANDAADFVAAHDPFRVNHKPSAVPFGAQPMPMLPRAQRPTLVLRGIIKSGVQTSAIVAGMPGREGDVVLSPGDTAGGLRVRRVTPTSVVINGMDTTWTLRIGSPWR